MLIVYASSAIPSDLYSRCFQGKDISDQQAQKFNRAVIAGLVQNGIRVCALSYRIGFSASPDEFISYDNTDNSINPTFCYIEPQKHLNKRISVAIQSYKQACMLLKRYPDAIVMADTLNLSVSLGVVMAARRYRRNSIGIVTDVPGIYNKVGFHSRLNLLEISMFSHYVFLTKAMNDVLNKKQKPYAVMEGLYYGEFAEQDTLMHKYDKFVILYAGTLDKKYGIDDMIEAMRYIDNSKIEMHIYGTGDYVDEIKRVTITDKRIKYFGLKDNREVVEAEKKASLLINPRSKDELFTQYSFPSKTIEYMSTGTPVLMQKLPGMPEEYYPYLFLYEGKASELALAIEKIVNDKTSAELHEFGEQARTFVRNSKNSRTQLKKVVNSLLVLDKAYES